MTKQGVKRALERVAESQGFVTAVQFTRFMGQKTANYMKEKFLGNLECVDGKYYFIDDIIDELMKRKDIKEGE